jgi:glycerol-3-phosphate dehydrogenase
MKRDIGRLKSEVFNVLIIGAGIHGAAIAYFLSSAGYKTALIDAYDFGSATSANSLKIIHGGLRYLQHADFKRIRESVISRKIMQKVAPYCLRNIPCIIPTRGFTFRSKPALYFALKFYDLLSADKNWSLPEGQKIAKGYTISKKELLSIIPDINVEDVNGGAVWFETLAENSERLVLEFIHLAHQAGCISANYVRALKINHVNKVVEGIDAEDTLSGEKFEIKSKIIVNSTGPSINSLLNIFDANKKNELPFCKAINIIVNKKLFGNYAVGLEGTREFQDHDSLIKKGRRFFFFVPWKNHTMIGTTYNKYDGDPSMLKVEIKDLEEIIEEVNLIYPSANIKIEDVTFYHAGILPRDAKQDSFSHEIQPAKKSLIIDEAKQLGLKGLFSVLSVKYTTAPFVALKFRELLKRMHPEIIVHSPSVRIKENLALSKENSNLFRKYGWHAHMIEDYFKKDTSLKEKVIEASEITEAEIKYFVEQECAVRLGDVIFRRSDIGSYSFPGENLLTAIAVKMASYLGWDTAAVNNEIEDVISKYSLLKV